MYANDWDRATVHVRRETKAALTGVSRRRKAALEAAEDAAGRLLSIRERTEIARPFDDETAQIMDAHRAAEKEIEKTTPRAARILSSPTPPIRDHWSGARFDGGHNYIRERDEW